MNTENIELNKLQKFVDTFNPKNNEFRKAVINFDNFNEAVDFAKKYNGTVQIIECREGEHYYRRTDYTEIKPIQLTESLFNTDGLVFYDNSYQDEDENAFIKKEILPLLNSNNSLTFSNIDSIMNKYRKIYDEICLIDENYKVIVINGEYYDTLPNEMMHFSYDANIMDVAVVL